MTRDRRSVALAVVAAAGLLYDAKVHLHLASGYDAVGGAITQGALFRLEAAVAVVAAVVVLVSDRRLAWALAGSTGVAGVAAVLLYRYVDVGAIGPIPSMYEPAWYPEKLHSLYAEAVVAVVWVVREALRVISSTATGSGRRTARAAAGRGDS